MFPPICNKDVFSRDDASKATGLFEEAREFRKRQGSLSKEATHSLTREATNFAKPNYSTHEEDKRDYFMSARPTRVRDDDNGEDQLDDDSISLPKAKILNCNFRRVVSDRSGSGKHFINTQQPSQKGSSDNSVIVMRREQNESASEYNDKSMIPYNKGIDDNIVRSGYFSASHVKKNGARTTKNAMAHSDNDIKQKAKNFRFTSQIECLDKVASMISDEKEVKSN